MKSNKYLNTFLEGTHFIYVIIVLICAVFIFRESAIASIVLFICSALILLHLFFERQNRRRKMKRYFESLAGESFGNGSFPMFNIPDPMAGVRVDGTFAWYNKPFRDAFMQAGFGKKLCDIFPELHVSEIIAEGGARNINVSANTMEYKIFPTIVKNPEPDKAAIILYFENISDVNSLKALAVSERPAVIITVIDNYDEAIADTGENEQLEITASIDRTLIGWINSRGGLVRKLEKDRYLAIVSRSAYEKIAEEKFSILNEIKNITVLSAAKPTLSIGVGTGGENISESDNFARTALDMALGRGGDQAAVCDGGKFSYYGGSTKEVEKRTRVKARVMAQSLKEHILSAENVVIMGHKNADIDAIGAAIGLSCAVFHMNRDAKIILNSSDPAVGALVDIITSNHYHDGLFAERGTIKDYIGPRTLLIVCDTHRPELTEMPELLETVSHKALLDHHRRSESFIEGCDLVYHEPGASSTCEMVAEILMYMDGGLSLSTIDATAIYAGIILDTKNFVFKTGSRTFEAAAYLRNSGVDTIKVKQLFRETPDEYKLKSRIVSDAAIDGRGICTAKVFTELPQSLIAQAADEMLDIASVNASFVISADGDGVRISSRSLGDINVQLIMEKLGGGGHALLAAAQLKNTTVSEASAQLEKAIDEYFEQKNK